MNQDDTLSKNLPLLAVTPVALLPSNRYKIPCVRNPFQILREKERLRQELQERLAQLEREIQALKMTTGMMMEDGDLEPPAQDEELSGVKMALRVLSDAGHPMHVKNISAAIKAKFNQDISSDTLASSIYRNMTRAKRPFFRKTDPNVYGLLVWQSELDKADNDDAA
jgi:hypothetical protein